MSATLQSSSSLESAQRKDDTQNLSSEKLNPKKALAYYFSTCLSLFFAVLPQDLVYEVFSWLTPRELIKLAEANRELRCLLIGKESKSIWKSVRERNWTPIPDSPPDMTELQWARLIFSVACKRCRVASGTIIWEVRIRVCRSCWELLSMPSHERPATPAFSLLSDTHRTTNCQQAAESSLLAVDPMDLLPSSEAWPELGDHRFYLPDVQRVQREITNCRSKIAAQLPGAREQFEFYISRCKSLRAEIEQHACLCQKKYAYLMSVDFDEQQVGRDRLRGFLLDMGHRDKDVQMALQSGGIDLSLGLTKAAFLANRGKIENLVQLKKATNVLAERRELAGLTYPELRRSSGVELHHFAPSLEDFLEWTLAANIINQDPEVVVTKQDFLALKTHFMDFVETWRTSKSLIIRRSVIGSETGSVPEDPKGEELLRATSAFLCVLFPLSDKVCMLWADGSFLKHMSDSRGIRDFERQKCLGRRRLDSQVAASLVRALGRDPETTTVDQMDTEEARFYCRGCILGSKISRTWRRCVIHYAEHHVRGGFQCWERLDAKETQWSMDRETYQWPSQPYSCLHCDRFQEEKPASPWRALLDHLIKSHDIHDSPVRGTDYLVDFTKHPLPVNMDPTGRGILQMGRTLFCRRCMDDRGKSKAFDHTGLASHVKTVHSVRKVRPSAYIEVS